MTPTIGRSHGIHAETGHVRAETRLRLCGVHRARERLVTPARSATCAISGAVGTFARSIRRRSACRQGDGTDAEPISDPGDSARPPRDVFCNLGVIASSVERLPPNPALAAHRVLEAEEFFSEGQKGSSAMPHKAQTRTVGDLTGSRMVRAYVTPAMENVVLWHERDISHPPPSA